MSTFITDFSQVLTFFSACFTAFYFYAKPRRWIDYIPPLFLAFILNAIATILMARYLSGIENLLPRIQGEYKGETLFFGLQVLFTVFLLSCLWKERHSLIPKREGKKED